MRVFAAAALVLACGLAALVEGVAALLAESHAKLRARAEAGGGGAALAAKAAKHGAAIAIAARGVWLCCAALLFGYAAERFESHWAAMGSFVVAAALTLAGLLASRHERVAKALGLGGAEAADMTEREIRQLMDDEAEHGIDEAEKAMIRGVFEFDNKTVDDVAVHRKDMTMLSADAGREEIIRTALGERFSRIPVYDGTIDNIIGVLHMKDLFRHAIAGGELDLRAMARKAYFVPGTKKTDALFEEMKANKAHMAIIVDEYGGTAGLVTMENLIEEIMGSIYDEDDDESEDPKVEPLYGGCYAVDGKAALDALGSAIGAALPVDEYDTVSGFIVGNIGRIPVAGEKPSFLFGELLFKVWAADDNRVVTAIVCDLRGDGRGRIISQEV